MSPGEESSLCLFFITSQPEVLGETQGASTVVERERDSEMGWEAGVGEKMGSTV